MHKLNLMPSEMLTKMSRKTRRPIFVFGACIFILLFLSSTVLINRSNDLLKEEIRSVHKDILEIKKTGEFELTPEDLNKRQNAYKDLSKTKINYARKIDELVKVVPDSVSIISLKAGEDRLLNFYCHAVDNASVAEAMENFTNTEDVSDIQLGFVRRREAKSEFTANYDFELLVELAKD